MAAEHGQASVEWAGVVLLVALALGAVTALAPRVDGRPLGALLAERITGTAERVRLRAVERVRPAGAEPARAGGTQAAAPSAQAIAPPVLPARGKRLRELLRKGARRGIAVNGLACYLRKSTETGDPDRIGDDVVDAVNCLNPADGWTGELAGPRG